MIEVASGFVVFICLCFMFFIVCLNIRGTSVERPYKNEVEEIVKGSLKALKEAANIKEARHRARMAELEELLEGYKALDDKWESLREQAERDAAYQAYSLKAKWYALRPSQRDTPKPNEKKE